MLTNILNQHPFLFTRPDLYSVIHKDFHTDEELTEFVATAIAGGSSAVVDTTASSHFGRCLLSGAATTADSGAQLQYDSESMALVAGEYTFFWGDAKLSEATDSAWAAGLCVTDASILHATTGVITITDGVMFRKADDVATIDAVIVRDSVEVSLQSAIYTIQSGVKFEMEIIVAMDQTAGVGTAYFYINGALVASLDCGIMPYSAEESLTMSHAFQSGSNVGTMTDELDYIGSGMSR